MAPSVLRTYGTLVYGDGVWRVDCEPHVRIRLKHVFGGIAIGQYRTISLSDNDQVCRDLLWFCDRYPLRISEGDLLRLEAGAARQLDRIETVAKILEGEFQLPSVEMALPPRPYQEQAAAAVFNAGSCLVVDDLGLGKTISAIRVMADPQTLPALAVVPSPLTEQWAEEIRRFVPSLRVTVLPGGGPKDLSDQDGNQPHVIVTSYHKLSTWADHLVGKIRFIVFDEAQELRTGGSAQKNIASAAIAREAAYTMGLTATPIYGYGGEIWNVIDTLAPGALGSQDEFLREWCSGYTDKKKASVTDPKALSAYLQDSGLMLRRTRRDVGRELPPVNKVVHNVTCERSAAFWDIESAAAELANVILDKAAKGFDRMQAGGMFNVMLRQATGVAKAPGVAALVRMIVEQGEKVVLFGWHREVYSIWKELLADLEPAWYTGSESTSKKRKDAARFIAGDTDVLVMSLRSGLGLNGLQQVCSTAVYGELDWSPGVHEQCTGRLDRDGQKRPVFAYYVVGDSGSDPIVCDVLGLKTGQVEGLRNPDGPVVTQTKVDPEHIKRLAEDYLRRFKKGRR